MGNFLNRRDAESAEEEFREVTFRNERELLVGRNN
jgi:hypothetical protein